MNEIPGTKFVIVEAWGAYPKRMRMISTMRGLNGGRWAWDKTIVDGTPLNYDGWKALPGEPVKA